MTDLDLSRIGCSDMPALLGLSKYDDPWSLWLRCVHGIQRHRDRDLDIMGDLGREREAATAKVYAKHILGIEKPELYKPETRIVGAVRCSPDFASGVGEGWDGLAPNGQLEALYEVKERNASVVHESWGPEGSGIVDPAIYVQVQAQLQCIRKDRDYWCGTSIPDLDEVHIAVALMGGYRRLGGWLVKRNEDVGAALIERAEKFYRDYILTGKEPPIDGSAGASFALHKLHPAGEKAKPREATPEEAELIEQYRAAKAELKLRELEHTRAKREEQRLKNELQAALKSDYSVRTPTGSKVTSFEVQPRVDDKALIRKLADAAGIDNKALEALKDSLRSGDARREVRVTLR